MTGRARSAVLVASAILPGLLGGLAAAHPDEYVDPSQPVRRVVGGPARPAARGQSGWSLPNRPRVWWRAQVEGNVEGGLAFDPKGAIVVGSSEALTQLGVSGRTEWVMRLDAAATSNPIVLADGTRVITTADGQLLGVTRRGNNAWKKRIPCPCDVSTALLLPGSDGGLVLAAAERIFSIDSAGAWRSSGEVPGRITGVFEHRHGVIVITQAGEVLDWDGVLVPRRLGMLGGRTEPGAVLTGRDVLTALVDNKRLTELDLRTTMPSLLVPDGPLAYQPAIATTARGETRLLSVDGWLLGYDREGRETVRLALDPARMSRDAGASERHPGKAWLLADDRGLVAFARPGQDPGVVLPDGEVRTLPGAGCGEPVALVGAGPRRFAGACRSGAVWLAGD